MDTSKPLGRRATRGAALTLASQGVKVATMMLTIVVVARILSPSDYGVVAMVSPVIGFLMIFQDLGFTQATVQAKTLDPEHTNALFWVNMAASITLAVVLLLISPLVGIFYGDTRAANVTAATAATVLVLGLKIQHQALLNREMRFAALSLADVVTACTTFVVTLISALILRSYWSIWIGAFVGSLASTTMIWSQSKWRPRWGANFTGIGKMVAFGGNLTGFSLINFFARNADNVLIAKARGAVELGLYDRSYKLMLFPLQNINAPLNRVMLPALSRFQDTPERYRKTYLLAIRGLALISMPGVITAAICSQDVVTILLGEQWEGAGPIFFWLSLTAISQIVLNTTGWLYISLGQGSRLLRIGALSSFVSIASFVIGLPDGAVGVARAYFFANLLMLPINYYYVTKYNPVTNRSLYAVQLPSLVAGAASYLISLTIFLNLPPVARVGGILAMTYCFTVICHISVPSGREDLRRFIRLILDALPTWAVRR